MGETVRASGKEPRDWLPETRPLQAEMVVFGDSVARGHYDPNPFCGWIGWPRRLAERLEIPHEKFVNAAAEQATIACVASEQLPVVRTAKPWLVVLGCGMTDILAGFESTHVTAALDEILGWARDNGALTLVAAVPVPPITDQPNVPEHQRRRMLRHLHEYNKELCRATERHEARYMGLDLMPEISRPRFWSPDGIHLNTIGHKYVTEAAAKLVARPSEFSVGSR